MNEIKDAIAALEADSIPRKADIDAVIRFARSCVDSGLFPDHPDSWVGYGCSWTSIAGAVRSIGQAGGTMTLEPWYVGNPRSVRVRACIACHGQHEHECLQCGGVGVEEVT